MDKAFVKMVEDINSIEDWRIAFGILKERRRVLESKIKDSFEIGDNAEIEYKGTTYVGVIQKINPKTVVLKVPDVGTFRCSPSILTLVEEWKILM